MPRKIDEDDGALPVIYALIKGDSGVGKSIQACSFPNVYVFDFDKRIESVRKFFKAKGKTDISYDSYSVTEYAKAYELLESWLKLGCPYRTLLFDTATTIIEAIMRYVNISKGDMAASKNKDSYGMDLSLGVIKVPALDDFKFLLRGMDQLLQTAKMIPNVHILMNAHVGQVQEQMGKVKIFRSVFAPGQTAIKIPQHFNEVFHMGIETGILSTDKTKRLIQTEAGGEDFARTTMNLLPTIDVTDKLLYDYLKEVDPRLEQTENLPIQTKTMFKIG